MSPVKQLGLGQTVARKVYEVIPHNAVSAWGIKIAEILTDAGKMPIEGVLYLKHGFVPDGVAAIVTQPLWSSIETAEKVAGVALKPERSIPRIRYCSLWDVYTAACSGTFWLVYTS